MKKKSWQAQTAVEGTFETAVYSVCLDSNTIKCILLFFQFSTVSTSFKVVHYVPESLNTKQNNTAEHFSLNTQEFFSYTFVQLPAKMSIQDFTMIIESFVTKIRQC